MAAIHQLTRELRFFLRPEGLPERPSNSWFSWNTGLSIAPALRLQITVSGEIDRNSGYVCNIKDLDKSLRKTINDCQVQQVDSPRFDQLLELIAAAWPKHAPPNVSWTQLRLVVTPQLSLFKLGEEIDMIFLTQQFEFSASHRLHSEQLSPSENQMVFGKCNHPAGHGHNYLVDVTVSQSIEASGGASPFSLDAFERVVKLLVIDRFDHKHLNIDLPEFRNLNPTVENIAATIFQKLDGNLTPAQLHSVRVYETAKTWAECMSSI